MIHRGYLINTMKFLKHKVGSGVFGIVEIVIGVVIVAALIPVAIVSITQAQGNFTGASLTLWLLIPFLIVLVVFFGIYKYIKK